MVLTSAVDRGYATATGRLSGFTVDHSEYPCAWRSSGSVEIMSSLEPIASRISWMACIALSALRPSCPSALGLLPLAAAEWVPYNLHLPHAGISQQRLLAVQQRGPLPLPARCQRRKPPAQDAGKERNSKDAIPGPRRGRVTPGSRAGRSPGRRCCIVGAGKSPAWFRGDRQCRPGAQVDSPAGDSAAPPEGTGRRQGPPGRSDRHAGDGVGCSCRVSQAWPLIGSQAAVMQSTELRAGRCHGSCCRSKTTLENTPGASR